MNNTNPLEQKNKLKTLLFVTNVDWYLISHRIKIIEEACKNGWKVVVACENTGKKEEIIATGAKFIDLKFSRSGTSPIKELMTLVKFYKLYNQVKPDVLHHVSLKPVIYGSFIAKLLNIKGVLNAVSGLGYAFTGSGKSLLQKVMLIIMKYGFNRDNLAFIFQNQEDYQELKDLKVIFNGNEVNFIKGSGVDLSKFSFSESPNTDRIKILLPCRMLWDKGVKELKIATDLLKPKFFQKATFILAGMSDTGNKACVPASYLEAWEDGEYVKWIGHAENMVEVYKNSHIVVLPSYREGMPKSLIEASAIGRPIITTDAVGCRECVEEGINGFKVPTKATHELATALANLIENESLRESMGRASRKKAIKEFDLNGVITKHLAIYDDLLYKKNSL